MKKEINMQKLITKVTYAELEFSIRTKYVTF